MNARPSVRGSGNSSITPPISRLAEQPSRRPARVGLSLELPLFGEEPHNPAKGLLRSGVKELHGVVREAAVREDEEVLDLDVERLRELHEGGNGWAPLPA